MSRSVRKQMKEAEAAAAAAAEETKDKTSDAVVEEEEEEEPSYNEIDKLQTLGINAGDIQKLKTGGCFTVESIIMRTKKELCNMKGLSEAKVDKIVEAAQKIRNSTFMTGTEFLSKRKDVVKITTGSSQLDQLLGGGIETMAITEVFGEFRTGKTQLCHTLCVTCQLPKNMGGGNGKVAYIDTEGTFRPERIGPIAERYGLEKEATLDNIIYARAFTHEHQMELIVEVAAKMVEDHFRILIIDSIIALFRVDYSGRGELADRQQKLGKMLNRLTKIAEEFNVAILLTNQVSADPGGGAMFVADAKKPVGGHVLAHASCHRLYLRKGRAEQRVCKIYDSPNLPEAEAIYQISDGGIIDAKD